MSAPPLDKDKDNTTDEQSHTQQQQKQQHLQVSPSERLEVGMLRQHEIEEFTLDEAKIMATCHPVSWSNCDATTFSVRRGPNYVSGQKSPSKRALYTMFAMDAYQLPHKMHRIFDFINIERYIDGADAAPCPAYDRLAFPLPPLLIINVMVPDYPPELMGGRSDGEGYQMIFYARLSEETRRELASPHTELRSPAAQLFSEFIHSDLVSSALRNRFKVIARIMNVHHTDFGFLANRLVKRYNGKPFLARTSSTFYHEPGRYFAVDIDAHVFGYPARQGLSYVKGTIQTAIYDVAFVVEGASDAQLPEQILSCCRISKMGVELCKRFPPHFAQRYRRHRGLSDAAAASKTDSHLRLQTSQHNGDDGDDDEEKTHTHIKAKSKQKASQSANILPMKHTVEHDQQAHSSPTQPQQPQQQQQQNDKMTNHVNATANGNNNGNNKNGPGWFGGMFG